MDGKPFLQRISGLILSKEVVRDLGDKEKEIDSSVVLNGVNKLLLQHAPRVPKFDPKEGKSIVDYVSEKVNEAKIASHKDQLLDLYNDWKIVRSSIDMHLFYLFLAERAYYYTGVVQSREHSEPRGNTRLSNLEVKSSGTLLFQSFAAQES